VVAYALAGTLKIDLTKDPLGADADGKPVYLKDIWPSNAEVAETVRSAVTADLYEQRYRNVFEGNMRWRAMGEGRASLTCHWNASSTYVQHPPYFEGLTKEPEAVPDILGARILGLFLDSITTDHISPAGSIGKTSPAAEYLLRRGVSPADFNSYGARRGNHEVMMRGTFANIRIKNQMIPGVEGGVTVHYPSGDQLPIYDAAMRYQTENVPLVVFAGKEYGTGSSRDWAAKGVRLLGVRAVIAQSFERIHRSNLIGMGVLPLMFEEGQSWQELGLKGSETVTLVGLEQLCPQMKLRALVTYDDDRREEVTLLCRIDTLDELNYYKNGGILHYVLRNLVSA
jgi:aconitate hydratase